MRQAIGAEVGGDEAGRQPRREARRGGGRHETHVEAVLAPIREDDPWQGQAGHRRVDNERPLPHELAESRVKGCLAQGEACDI